MTRTSLILILILMLVLAAGAPAVRAEGADAREASQAASQPQVIQLFDGKSLDGWEGDPKVWRVRGGLIVGGSLNGNRQNEFLATKKSYGDFVLRLEYRLVGTEGFINSGVQFRSVRMQNPPNEMYGFQADIGAGHSGCLYDESRRKKFLARATDEQIKRLEKPGEWNEYEVRCAGAQIQIVLNGEKTVDYIEPDPSVPRTGLIGLQIHGGNKAEVSFRNIRLEEMTPDVASRCFGLDKNNWKRTAFPDHVEMDLGVTVEISGFTYQPAQAVGTGGYEFYVSRDGKAWGQPVSRGRLENTDHRPGGRVVYLDKAAAGRFLKVRPLNANSQPIGGETAVGVLGIRVK